jgi:hypothetical protein
MTTSDERPGQSGLNVGARLQAMGLSCLLIDKNDRVGDNWRNRYRVCNPQLPIPRSNSSSDTRHPRPSPIHPHGIHAVPIQLATLHTKRQTR